MCNSILNQWVEDNRVEFTCVHLYSCSQESKSTLEHVILALNWCGENKQTNKQIPNTNALSSAGLGPDLTEEPHTDALAAALLISGGFVQICSHPCIWGRCMERAPCAFSTHLQAPSCLAEGCLLPSSWPALLMEEVEMSGELRNFLTDFITRSYIMIEPSLFLENSPPRSQRKSQCTGRYTGRFLPAAGTAPAIAHVQFAGTEAVLVSRGGSFASGPQQPALCASPPAAGQRGSVLQASRPGPSAGTEFLLLPTGTRDVAFWGQSGASLCLAYGYLCRNKHKPWMLGIAGGCVPAGKLRGDDLRQGQFALPELIDSVQQVTTPAEIRQQADHNPSRCLQFIGQTRALQTSKIPAPQMWNLATRHEQHKAPSCPAGLGLPEEQKDYDRLSSASENALSALGNVSPGKQYISKEAVPI
ncbi:hypothetical protein Anapl_02213 [Anas platyrhynchos]|uniref:Uncharacterized protein n=1 Tax=Anas platyrhynchos TaxID=8839 RepID=R0K0T9_ANAPL|nr:hypothetical protein Anapl_02213 [Anas platyrhynchos]